MQGLKRALVFIHFLLCVTFWVYQITKKKVHF